MAARLKKKIQDILDRSKPHGWVLEPDAKQILSLAGIAVPEFRWARKLDQVVASARAIGYPLVAKIVSPAVIHKSDIGGVAVGIGSEGELKTVFRRFARHEAFAGVLLEKVVEGLELIVGGKVDLQFGPVVLLGIGGKGVEIYQDRTLRLAPVQERDVLAMINSLTAGRLLSGFRGETAIDMQALIGLMTAFSKLLLKMADQITSVDLNPVICSPQGCMAADARIILKSGSHDTAHPKPETADSH
jgi:acetate---CoA ligase (ADP-forming) subunit beta